MDRRAFLRTATLSTLAAISTPSFSSGQVLQRVQERRQALTNQMRARQQVRQRIATMPKKIPIGVQLYSVRYAAERDLPGTLKTIARMGYEGVEFAGYYGHDIEDVRKMLDDNGLKCCGTHTLLDQLRGNNFERTAEINQILGSEFVIVPWIDTAYLYDADGNRRIAEEFNRFAERAKPFGLYVGYHAYHGDARLVDGISAWERFFDATVPEVVHQMDVANYKEGNGDPYAMIEKYPGRSRTIHLSEIGQDKDISNRPTFGNGIVDWQRVFELSETVGGVEWYIVEDVRYNVEDDRERASLNLIEKNLAALRRMEK